MVFLLLCFPEKNNICPTKFGSLFTPWKAQRLSLPGCVVRVESKPKQTRAAPAAYTEQSHVREPEAGLAGSSPSLQIHLLAVPDDIVKNPTNQHKEYFTEPNIHKVNPGYSSSHTINLSIMQPNLSLNQSSWIWLKVQYSVGYLALSNFPFSIIILSLICLQILLNKTCLISKHVFLSLHLTL